MVSEAMRGQRMRLWTVLFASLGLTACASFAPPPQEHFYRLPGLAVDAPLASPLLPGLLAVEEPVSDSLHADSAMLYSVDPQGLSLYQYDNHLWLDSPLFLIRQVMIDHLKMAGVVGSVLGGEHAYQPDWRLLSVLRRFEQIRGETSTAVVVAMDISLMDSNGEQNRPSVSYEERVAVVDDTPLSAVNGYQRALQRIMQRFVADLPN